MSNKIDPEYFKGDSRSLQLLAQEILTLPFDREPKSNPALNTTFISCVEDSIHVHEKKDASSQLEIYGVMNYTDRASALADLVKLIAKGKHEFDRDEIETLKDALTITAGQARYRRQIAAEELDECRRPEQSLSALSNHSAEDTRARASAEYYSSQPHIKALEEKIPPLFKRMADKLGIILDTPEIQ